jgi:hypothetical protein
MDGIGHCGDAAVIYFETIFGRGCLTTDRLCGLESV